MEGDGGNLEVMGVGSVWEVGEERAADGILWQGGGSWEKQEINFAILHNILQQKKHTEAGTTKEGDGKRAYKVQEAGNSDLLVPHPPSPPICGEFGQICMIFICFMFYFAC